jgi:hypothetical protein
VGLDIHGHVNEQGCRAAYGVGANPAVREFGKVRKVGAAQFAADDAGGFDRILAWPWSQGGGCDLALL